VQSTWRADLLTQHSSTTRHSQLIDTQWFAQFTSFQLTTQQTDCCRRSSQPTSFTHYCLSVCQRDRQTDSVQWVDVMVSATTHVCTNHRQVTQWDNNDGRDSVIMHCWNVTRCTDTSSHQVVNYHLKLILLLTYLLLTKNNLSYDLRYNDSYINIYLLHIRRPHTLQSAIATTLHVNIS